MEFKQAFAAAMVAKVKEIPETPTREIIESVQDTIPHLQEVAEPLYLQALAIYEQKLGVNHPNTVICRKNLERLRAANP